MTDDEIDKLGAGNNYPGTVPGMRKFARAILAAHTEKLLAGVDTHRWKVLDLLPRGSEELDEAIVAYAAAAAAQARMKALDDAMLAVNSGVLGHGECAAAIESLKGKV